MKKFESKHYYKDSGFQSNDMCVIVPEIFFHNTHTFVHKFKEIIHDLY